MRIQLTQGHSVSRLWHKICYSLLILLLLLTSLFPVMPATAAVFGLNSTTAQTTLQKEGEKPDPIPDPLPAPAAEPAGAGQPTRNALTGNPIPFSNSSYITINDATSAVPYPSTINVQGITTTLNGLTVSLYGVSHTFPADIDILLVGPAGQKMILMSDAGGGTDIVGINLNFDDNAASSLSTNAITGGTYKPSNVTSTNADTFPSPAPASPYSATLSTFNNTDPNGNWQLYIVDDAGGDSGSLSGGWSITLYVNQAAVLATGGSNQTAWRTTNFASPLQATVKDSSANPIAGTVVTFTAPTTGASATFAGGETVYTATTNAQGIVTTPLLTANSIAGTYSITATAENISFVAYYNLTNLPGPPDTIAVSSGNNQNAVTTLQFSQPLVAIVKDSDNSPVSNVAVTFTTPATGASATFANGSNIYTGTTNSAGLVTTTNLTANSITGAFNVLATVAGVPTPASFTLTNTNPAKISFESSSYTINEGMATGSVTLTRSLNSSGAVTVSIMAGNVTASSDDYSLSSLSGGLDTSFSPGSGANAEIYTIRILAGNKMLISGLFTSYNGISRGRVARLNSDGSLDTTLDSSVGANALVESTAIQPDGKIILVGDFTTYNNITRTKIARINTDGSLDESFNPGFGANSTINEVALQPDGKIIIGGSFTTYNNISRPRVARLNSDGSLDETFVVDTGLNGGVLGLAVQSSGKIVVSGFFTSYNTVATPRLVQLNTDGSIDTAFTTNLGTGPANAVWEMATQPDGKILIGGDFTSFNNITRNKLARLNTDGTLDTSFNPGVGPDSGQRPFAVQPDGKILIGGDFTTYNNKSRNHFARINSDGSLDTTFDVGTGANNYVATIALRDDGKVLIGGRFTSYNGTAITRIARIGGITVSWANGDIAPKTLSFPITQDLIPELNEQFVLTLTDITSPYSLSSPLSTTVTIVDNDPLLATKSGNNQTAQITQAFNQPMVASVNYLDGTPLSGTVVTFTAPASGASGVFAGGSASYIGTTDASGLVTATIFTANSEPGSYNLVVSATTALTATNFSLTNTLLTSNLSLSSAPNPSVVGQPVTFTATLNSATASGNVTFTIGSVQLASPIQNGIANYTTNTLPIGSYVVTATYAGDATHTAGQSATYTHTVVSACDPLLVTAISDDGAATNCGTFSYALVSASSGTTITFALTQGDTITFTGSLTPTLKPGVAIDGGTVSGIVLNGNGVGGNGLQLGGNNTLTNLTIRNFGGRELLATVSSVANHLFKVKVQN